MLKQLSGLDTMFFYLENTRTPLEVSSLQIYDPSTAPDGKITFEQILATFESRLDRASIFRRKLLEVPLSLDHPYWVEDEDFDIEYHIRHISLPKPGDWRQLMIQVSRLQSQHLDKTRPLWEVYVIDGLDHVEGLSKGSFGLFMKMHHASVDGVSGQEIQVAIHDLEPLTPYVPEDGLRRQKSFVPVPSGWSLLAKSPVNNVRKTFSLIKGIAGALPGVVKAGMENRGQSEAEVPRTIFNVGRATANRVIGGRFFDLAQVKAITEAVPGTKINDAVLTVVGGALTRYLSQKTRLPTESMVAGCPVNVRTDDGRHSEHDNMVSMMTTSMHTDISDPVERMKTIHLSTTKAKALTRTMGGTTLTEIPMNLPAPLAKNLFPPLVELLARSGKVPFNTIVSNVPGLQQPIYLAGARMVRFLGMGPVVDQSGLFHTAFSYDGAMSIGFTACREMMSDPAFYAECIQAAWDELAEAALGIEASPARETNRPQDKKKVRTRKKKAVRVQPATDSAPEVANTSPEVIETDDLNARKIPLPGNGKPSAKEPKSPAPKPKAKKRGSTSKTRKAGRKKAVAKRSGPRKPTPKKPTPKKATSGKAALKQAAPKTVVSKKAVSKKKSKKKTLKKKGVSQKAHSKSTPKKRLKKKPQKTQRSRKDLPKKNLEKKAPKKKRVTKKSTHKRMAKKAGKRVSRQEPKKAVKKAVKKKVAKAVRNGGVKAPLKAARIPVKKMASSPSKTRKKKTAGKKVVSKPAKKDLPKKTLKTK